MRKDKKCSGPAGERGVTLVFVAVSLVVLLGFAALAVDLAMLYVARNDAQRAADAAALAGAQAFADSGCSVTYSCGPSSASQTLALEQAETVGAQNRVLGEQAAIAGSDVSFHYPYPNEPQITVTVQRSQAAGNAIPTIFGRILGQNLANVSATATAETYFGPPSDLLPFVVSNCDPVPPANPPPGTLPNTSCGAYSNTGYANSYLAYPFILGAGTTTPSVSSWAIGQMLQLHCGNCSTSGSATPSQFYMIDFQSNDSANVIGNEILNDVPITDASCGATLPTAAGGKTGQVIPTVNQRIYASADGPNNGQDVLLSPILPGGIADGLPLLSNMGDPLYNLEIQVGTNNPEYPVITQDSAGIYPGPSPSLVTVPVYEYVSSGGQTFLSGASSTALNPGHGDSVEIAGYLRLFIVDAWHTATAKIVDTVVTGITPCNGNSGGDPVPIRLIQAPTL